MSYWIRTNHANLEFLESIEVEVGEYDGQCFRNCEIPYDAYDDLYEYWGFDAEEGIMFGEEKPDESVEELLARVCPPRKPRVQLIESRTGKVLLNFEPDMSKVPVVSNKVVPVVFNEVVPIRRKAKRRL